MKSLISLVYILCLSITAKAALPINCQLEMLQIAAPALKSDVASSIFFDLSQVQFETSDLGEPTVIFIGQSADISKKQDCRAEVKMQIPELVLGCPEYTLKSITASCL